MANWMALPLISHHAQGRTIDLGCGLMPFGHTLPETVTAYHTLDLWPRSERTTYVGDIQDMNMIEDATYDTALCFDVLEHVPEPARAMGEIYRILRPGGCAIIAVPHLSRLHDEPLDFYRYTRYGLQHLFLSSGFELEEIRQRGGIFSFVGHQVSSLLIAATWHVPGVRQVAWLLNKWLITLPCYAIDRVTAGAGLLALGYVGVGRRPSRTPRS